MVELELADWQRVLDTNLTSAFVVGREAARRMAKRGHGKVINIGSLTSEFARATVAPYTVAKGDSWARIARRQGLPLSGLLRQNGASADTPLRPGMVLKLDATRP